MTDLSLIIAGVSASMALASACYARQSNKIATRAIDEQLRPQLVLFVKRYTVDGKSRDGVFIKNIGNASAMNVKISIDEVKINGVTENSQFIAGIGEPAVLEKDKECIVETCFKDQLMEGLRNKLDYTVNSLLIDKNSYKITITYEDISGKRRYKSFFTTVEGGVVHHKTIV